MKRLTLVRHGRAEPAAAGQQDFERPLNQRGREEASERARQLAADRMQPDTVLASSAPRAAETARIFAAALDLEAVQMQTDERLYLAAPMDLLKLIRQADDTIGHLMLFGHNPGLSDFARALSGDPQLDELPTAGVCSLELDIDRWSGLAPGIAATISRRYP